MKTNDDKRSEEIKYPANLRSKPANPDKRITSCKICEKHIDTKRGIVKHTEYHIHKKNAQRLEREDKTGENGISASL